MICTSAVRPGNSHRDRSCRHHTRKFLADRSYGGEPNLDGRSARREKGLSAGIEGVANVAERIPNVEYHIVGSGPLLGKLERKVDALDIGENVTFLNPVTDER